MHITHSYRHCINVHPWSGPLLRLQVTVGRHRRCIGLYEKNMGQWGPGRSQCNWNARFMAGESQKLTCLLGQKADLKLRLYGLEREWGSEIGPCFKLEILDRMSSNEQIDFWVCDEDWYCRKPHKNSKQKDWNLIVTISAERLKYIAPPKRWRVRYLVPCRCIMSSSLVYSHLVSWYIYILHD